jgi:ATP-dependent helicase/DNAse subunit B
LQQFFQELNDICKKHFFEEKVLIVPSFSIGRQLLQAYTLAGNTSLNLKVNTLHGVAIELCQPYLQKNNLSLLSDTLAKHYLMGLLEQLKQDQELTYFDQLEISTGFTYSMYQSLQELKYAGCKPSDLSDEFFQNTTKAADMRRIFSGYEQILVDQKQLDHPSLLQLAMTQSSLMPSKQVFIMLENPELHSLEKNFMQQLIQPNGHTLSFPTVNEEELSTSIQDSSIEMFRSYGENNELREVIRYVKENKLPFDQVAIIQTTKEPYTQLFYDLSQQFNLPVTFGGGISIKNSRPAQLYFGLLDWIQNQYSVAKLCTLLRSGYFNCSEEGAPSSAVVVKRFKSADIGWGRERYLTQIKKKLTYLEQKIKKELTAEQLEYVGREIEEYTWISTFIEKIMKQLPDTQATHPINYASFTKALVQIIEEFACEVDPLDKEAKYNIMEELQTIADSANEEIRVEDAILRLTEMIEPLSIGSSNPQPGDIHMTHYQQGLWIQRPYSFIVGLDNKRFPGQTREDPILLDTERKNITEELSLKSNRTRDHLAHMHQLLSLTKGTMILSYSAFDPVENREVFPSSLLLYLYRLKKGKTDADYSELLTSLGTIRGFIPRQSKRLDEAEWWLDHLLLQRKNQEVFSNIFQLYPHLEQGAIASEYKNSARFTEYDGRIQMNHSLFDPKKNHSLVVSSSRLELLGKCPYAYFLKYVLKIETPEEIEYTPGKWLNPAQRGTLLHSVFERFYRELKNRAEKPQQAIHEELLYQIAEECIKEHKEETPPPSELVFESERDEILASCKVFLLTEEEKGVHSTPSFFELSFGRKGEMTIDLNQEVEEVEINLPSGDKFYLRGIIDRVDQVQDGTYQIIDYKTGSTYNYEEREYIKGGRQLQHTLYAIALEKILQEKQIDPSAKVSLSGYSFPSVKGEGQRFLRPQENRELFYEVVENLLDMITHGHFGVTDDSSDCKYCDFTTICERKKYDDAVSLKHHDPEAEGLSKFRRVRSYD